MNLNASIQLTKTLDAYNVSIDVGTVMACRAYLKDAMLDVARSCHPMITPKIKQGMDVAILILDMYLNEKGISYEKETE